MFLKEELKGLNFSDMSLFDSLALLTAVLKRYKVPFDLRISDLEKIVERRAEAERKFISHETLMLSNNLEKTFSHISVQDAKALHEALNKAFSNTEFAFVVKISDICSSSAKNNTSDMVELPVVSPASSRIMKKGMGVLPPEPGAPGFTPRYPAESSLSSATASVGTVYGNLEPVSPATQAAINAAAVGANQAVAVKKQSLFPCGACNIL